MKVSIIGAGNVGGTLAQRIVEADLSDVVLVDIAQGFAQGKAYDLADSRSLTAHERRISGSTEYWETAGSDIVVITAGLARQPGMTREELLKKNTETIRQVVKEVIRYSPQAIILMVTNPLDILTYVALKSSGFPKHRIIGMGGVLDSARFVTLLAEELNVSYSCVQALVIGAHGDTMIPLTRYSTVSGINITELLSGEKLAGISQRTVKRGAEIVSLLGKGSAYYAPSAAAFKMVKAILKDERRIVSASVLCEGEYGLDDVCIGVPVRLGKNGVEEIISLQLSKEEKEQLSASAVSIKSTLSSLILAH
ncbi:MAG: malate dehydrogenase [Candidatus Omnitrophica bacterium]|nr:malate dehydrogenase [Candidatus Omnitrophota bacterium]MBU4478477.1 malate dehydrogenase [Candidatus Omnitrophota bacterium]MCG2703778.1 malate dehydrogenase [Candidatus Omnitrophota bacterium]